MSLLGRSKHFVGCLVFRNCICFSQHHYLQPQRGDRMFLPKLHPGSCSCLLYFCSYVVQLFIFPTDEPTRRVSRPSEQKKCVNCDHRLLERLSLLGGWRAPEIAPPTSRPYLTEAWNKMHL